MNALKAVDFAEIVFEPKITATNQRLSLKPKITTTNQRYLDIVFPFNLLSKYRITNISLK